MNQDPPAPISGRGHPFTYNTIDTIRNHTHTYGKSLVHSFSSYRLSLSSCNAVYQPNSAILSSSCYRRTERHPNAGRNDLDSTPLHNNSHHKPIRFISSRHKRHTRGNQVVRYCATGTLFVLQNLNPPIIFVLSMFHQSYRMFPLFHHPDEALCYPRYCTRFVVPI